MMILKIGNFFQFKKHLLEKAGSTTWTKLRFSELATVWWKCPSSCQWLLELQATSCNGRDSYLFKICCLRRSITVLLMFIQLVSHKLTNRIVLPALFSFA